MNARVLRAVAVALVIGCAWQLAGLAQASAIARQGQAEAVVDALVAREFSKVAEKFDAAMAKALPGDALAKSWDSTLVQVGKFVRRIETTEQRRGVYTAVTVACEFERAKLDVTVVYDAAGAISGLAMRPPTSAPPYAVPDYVTPTAYTEQDITVGIGQWALPGTLSMPVGVGPFPAVVLVHGSGPNDRDESIGPNKIFKDLALGLASRGVVVLRYDKRTLVHQAKLATFKQATVQDETIDDALAAAALLRRNPSVDSSKIYVLGHSLGGMVAPRIAAADPKLAGIVVMAGAVRSLDQSILDQTIYIAKSDGTVTEAEQNMIDEAAKTVDIVGKLTVADAQAGKLVSGAPASYWLDLRGFDPPAAAAKLTMRMLVLQGGRDYQVTIDDFEKWKTALAGKPNAQCTVYPSLNHLFITGTGKSVPAEYSTPGHLAVEVVNDIARWINK